MTTINRQVEFMPLVVTVMDTNNENIHQNYRYTPVWAFSKVLVLQRIKDLQWRPRNLLEGSYRGSIRLYKLERIFSQQVDLKSALDSKDFL